MAELEPEGHMDSVHWTRSSCLGEVQLAFGLETIFILPGCCQMHVI